MTQLSPGAPVTCLVTGHTRRPTSMPHQCHSLLCSPPLSHLPMALGTVSCTVHPGAFVSATSSWNACSLSFPTSLSPVLRLRRAPALFWLYVQGGLPRGRTPLYRGPKASISQEDRERSHSRDSNSKQQVHLTGNP